MKGIEAAGLSPEWDGKREECGVFGIYAPGKNVSAITYNALFALQHRGQDAAAVAVSYDNGRIMGTGNLGTVEEALNKGENLKGLPPGNVACGHVRYSTHSTKSEHARLAAMQPMLGGGSDSKFALSHNGHLINFDDLISEHPDPEKCSTDSQLITYLISEQVKTGRPLLDSIVAVASQLKGAYSMVVMGEDKIYGVRDPKGFRPLMLGGFADGGKVLASERAPLDIIGAEFSREIEPGEVVEINGDGVKIHRPFDPAEVETKVCAFEFIYFSRPDNIIEGELVSRARRKAGIELASLYGVEADVVVGSPDSGTAAANGYAYKSGLPLEEGLVKNRYVGRSFMGAVQAQRNSMVDAKFNAVPEIVAGKKVVLVDDSIIRGTTTKKLVYMLRQAGAAEVHLRIASAPYQWPCFMGMDTGNRNDLIAAHLSVDQIRALVDADSLEFLPLVDLEKTFGRAAGKVCMACMDGKYPVPPPPGLLETNGSHHLLEKTTISV